MMQYYARQTTHENVRHLVIAVRLYIVAAYNPEIRIRTNEANG